MPRFQDKVVVVTGGASGIGAGVADAFAKEGARVAVLDIKPPAARRRSTASDGIAATWPTSVRWRRPSIG